jgi:hypothetical protein
MSTTKATFQTAIANSMAAYPTAAKYYQAQDPRLLASLDAIATMLAMLSAENETAAMEPFTMSRDITVKADAAIKGVIPWGTPTSVILTVTNGHATDTLSILTGRALYDAAGNAYVTTSGVTLAPAASGTVTALQYYVSSSSTTVSTSEPFYKIQLDTLDSGSYLYGVTVTDENSVVFEYVPDFVNVSAGEKTYHIEGDETGALSITFGITDLAGYQPSAGEVYTVDMKITAGGITVASGSPFSLQYTTTAAERSATLVLSSVATAGADPLTTSTLREICSFPSVYDSNAVYLGNFDFLLRRNIGSFDFLSVWNEQTEEGVRGASVDNINTLFVAAQKTGMTTSALQTSIESIIAAADDSYNVKFVDIATVLIPITVEAQVSSTYDFSAIKAKIQELIIDQYGASSAFAQRGQAMPLYKDVWKLLYNNIAALQATFADMQITITNPTTTALPEQWKYVDLTSLTVNVTQATYQNGAWAQ